MKALRVSIFEDKSIGNCSNNGISARHNEILLLHPYGNIEVDEKNPPENLCKVVERVFSFGTYKHIEPVAKTKPGNVGWMAGGSICHSSDARFREYSDYPLMLHDRQETTEEYEFLSR